MNKYKQLTAADRSKIEVLLLKKYTLTEIACTLGFDKSTISREVKKRATPKGYLAHNAQLNYETKRERCGKRKILSFWKYRSHVIDKLIDGWSPEQISGRLKLERSSWYVSPETIYQFIYEDQYVKDMRLYQYLRQGKKRRTKWKGRATKKDRIPNRVSIHQRPAVVSYQVEFGHWEGDSVIYPNKRAINTVNELKSGYVEFSVLERKTADLTAKAMVQKLSTHEVKTVTIDNGSEFTRHEVLIEQLGVQTYFCDPYSSWQRGANENTNGLLRRYLPKRKNIDNLTQEELDEIAADLNSRPRKRLGYRTPSEVYRQEMYNLSVKRCT
jgi:IS30 family transposase